MIIPTRSEPNLSMILEIICFDFSNRFGAMSSASMLLETSKAKTTSTPSLFTVFILVPIFGLVNETINKDNPMSKKASFNTDLKVDVFGANCMSKLLFANFRCVFFFHQNTHKKTTITAGIIARK